MSEKIPIVHAPGIRGSFYVNNIHHVGSYVPFMRLMDRMGFEPHFFQPDWRRPHPMEWAENMAAQAVSAAQRNGNGRVALSGFSCGGLVAVLATAMLESRAPDVEVVGLAGYSVSPWFGEERLHRSHALALSEVHDMSETLKANLGQLGLPKIECPVQLYVGTQELHTVQDMHHDALAAWPQAESIKPPCAHNIFADPYLQAIEHNIGRLATER